MATPDVTARNSIVIWGAGGHAMVVADIIRLSSGFDIVGFLDDVNSDRHGTAFCGAPILGGREQLDRLRDEGVRYMILGFGNNRARLALADLVRTHGFSLATAIHPTATIASGVPIGEGTVIAAGAVINPGAKIGANVIVNTCASVDHESVIEDGAHIGPGARLGGKVMVGRGAWIGIGAAVIGHLAIGSHSLIGAGAVVVSDMPSQVVAYGVPAKVQGPEAAYGQR